VVGGCHLLRHLSKRDKICVESQWILAVVIIHNSTSQSLRLERSENVLKIQSTEVGMQYHMSVTEKKNP
jgi:hypothetical protein